MTWKSNSFILHYLFILFVLHTTLFSYILLPIFPPVFHFKVSFSVCCMILTFHNKLHLKYFFVFYFRVWFNSHVPFWSSAPLCIMSYLWVSYILLQAPSPSVGLVGRQSLCFHLYMYVCIFISHQDRLEDMKCFHSYVCMSVTWLNRYEERFRRMMHTSPGLGYDRAQLMMCTCKKKKHTMNRTMHYGQMEAQLKHNLRTQVLIQWNTAISFPLLINEDYLLTVFGHI